MGKKLTLHLNKTILGSANIYAEANDISLSKHGESYITNLTKVKIALITSLQKVNCGHLIT